MTNAQIVDRVIYRILAFKCATVTDHHLSGRVFGNRLSRPNSWALRTPSAAWRQYLQHQMSSLVRNDWAYTCVSDLAGFYLTIDTDVLLAVLRDRGVENTVLDGLARVFSVWHHTSDFAGLPVGGEGSGVLSNAYLDSVDGLLNDNARDYAMYGDDFAIFDASVRRGRQVLQAVDEHLQGLTLKRNLGKTIEFLDAVDAVDHIQNHSLASIDAVDDTDDEIATEMLYELWDEHVLGRDVPDLTEVHFALGRLAKRRDCYAVPGLLRRRDLLQLDPRSTLSYLAETSGADQNLAEELTGLLATPTTATTEALHLHVCRCLACHPRGSEVAAQTELVLDNRVEYREATRAMAAQARRRCPGWSYEDALDRADVEPEFAVRRSLVGSTRGMRDHLPTRRLALRELTRRDPALAPTAVWALAA